MIPKIDCFTSGIPKTDLLKGVGTITYYKKFAYINIDEGAHLGFIEMEKIHSLISYVYEDCPYVFLCNRKVSYSVNPIAYTILNKVDRLRSIAIVKGAYQTYDLEVEKHFIKKPFNEFNTFEEAANWINSHI